MQVDQSNQLNNIIELLESKYINNIAQLSAIVRNNCIRLKEEDTKNLTTIYNSFCINLISELQFFLQQRTTIVIPYIRQLSDKLNISHNCMECNGNCNHENETFVSEIENIQYKIRDLLNRLQKITPPLYSVDELPTLYKNVREEMIKLNSLIFDLFYFEESTLIPKIIESQKLIHATN